MAYRFVVNKVYPICDQAVSGSSFNIDKPLKKDAIGSGWVALTYRLGYSDYATWATIGEIDSDGYTV